MSAPRPLSSSSASWDDRQWPDSATKTRSGTERDCDRILYSSAFHRLAAITQVAPSGDRQPLHSRLTHSLKVAQVSRRLAQRLKRIHQTGLAKTAIGELDVDAAEAAALGHDLGHPPFGHIAEDELNKLARAYGGFEGNAQSFRILTRLSKRAVDRDGLNLTRRTLNAVLKYPWVRDLDDPARNRKWGAYAADHEAFEFARELVPDDRRSLEAEIMDWADDLTYAVHDMDDFYRAGLIPLERLFEDPTERQRLVDGFFEDGDGRSVLRARLAKENPVQLESAASELFGGVLDFRDRYHGRTMQRVILRSRGSALITRYIEAFKVVERAGQVDVEIDPAIRAEVAVLKELVWFYVIDRPGLATIQEGQRRIIRTLHERYTEDVLRAQVRLFPPQEQELVDIARTDDARSRVVTDYIAGMTEARVFELYQRLMGTTPASVLDL